jgi:hypothetical protein
MAREDDDVRNRRLHARPQAWRLSTVGGRVAGVLRPRHSLGIVRERILSTVSAIWRIWASRW